MVVLHRRGLAPLVALLTALALLALLAGCVRGSGAANSPLPANAADVHAVATALAQSQLANGASNSPVAVTDTTAVSGTGALTDTLTLTDTGSLTNTATTQTIGHISQAQALGISPDRVPTPVPTPAPQPTPVNLSQTENILVLGTDTRNGWNAWRTDSIMIVAIDRAAKQVGIISIPRDLYVDIPTYGPERINAADYVGEKTHYPGGGPALAMKTVELATGIPTQHYALLQQDGLVKLVDALGGVTVTLDCPLYEMAPEPHAPGGYVQFTLPAGPNFLDGIAAKKFVTYRYIQSNFGRERRQQQLLWAIRNRALRGDVLPRIPQLLEAVQGLLITDLSLPDIIGLGALGMQLKPSDVHSSNIGPELLADYTTPAGAMVLRLRSRATLRAHLAQLFQSKILSDVGKPAASGCPAAPRGFVDLSGK
jgi:polyisoprenyl-teichoic acid--peptidoglycan teichoic acid transferase